MSTFVPRVDCYLVHWNAPKWCESTVAHLLSSRGIHLSVTVVNNGGGLNLPESVVVMESNDNVGFAGGANIALDLAANRASEYVFIGCHDLQLEPSAMLHLIETIQSDSKLGIVGPVLDGEGTDAFDLDWISGSGMLMRREVATKHRFDERFGSYVEDVDFCYQARRSGWRIGRCGKAYGSTNGSVDEDQKLVLMHSNTMAFFAVQRMPRLFIGRLVRVLSNMFRSLYRGRFTEARLYGKSAVLGLTKAIIFLSKRNRK